MSLLSDIMRTTWDPPHPQEGNKEGRESSCRFLHLLLSPLLGEKSCLRLKHPTPISTVTSQKNQKRRRSQSFLPTRNPCESLRNVLLRVTIGLPSQKSTVSFKWPEEDFKPIMRHHTIQELHHELYKHAFLCSQHRPFVAHSAHSVSCS